MHLTKGVTFFDNLGHGEFTPLNQWIREYELFHKISKISFFHRYRTWKLFISWRTSVLHAKISAAKKALTKNLFILHPILRDALLNIKSYCFEVSLKRLIQVEKGKSYNLQEFMDVQKEYISTKVASSLSDWQSYIRIIVEYAGVKCLQKEGFHVEWSMPKHDIKPVLIEKEVEGEDGIKIIQMVEVKTKFPIPTEELVNPPKKKLTFTEQAARRAECKRLQRFVKMIDYVILQALFSVTVDSTCDLLTLVFQGCTDADVMSSSKEISTRPTGEDHQLDSNVDFSGIVFNNRVGTKELTESGHDGFPFIQSRIAKSSIIKIQLQDDIHEEHISSQGVVAMDIDIVKKDSKTKVKEYGLQKELPKRPLFKTELLVSTDPPELYFDPSLENYMNLADTLLKKYLEVAESVPLLTNTVDYLNPANQSGDSDVRGLEEAEFSEGVHIGPIVTEGIFFKEICARLRGTLLGIFSNSTRFMRTLDVVRDMWIENQQYSALSELEKTAGNIALVIVNLSNLQQVDGGISASLMTYAIEQGKLESADFDSSKISLLKVSSTVKPLDEGFFSPLVEFFEKALFKYSNQLSTMISIPLTESICNILIQTERLKQVFLPSPKKCFDDVSKILPGLARDKNEILLSEVQVWVRILQTPPQSVDAFVEYLHWLETGLFKLI